MTGITGHQATKKGIGALTASETPAELLHPYDSARVPGISFCVPSQLAPFLSHAMVFAQVLDLVYARLQILPAAT